MAGLILKKTAEKPYLAPLGYPGKVTARKTLRFDIVHPEHGVVGQLSGDLHTSKNPKPMVDRGMVDAYLFAWAEHGGRKVGKGDFNLKSVYLTHHPETGEKLADVPKGDEDYAKIHPSVKNLLGPARLRGVLSQLRSHGVQRVYSTMRTTGIRGVERPKPEGAPVKFFEPPTTIVPPFRLREEVDQLVEQLLYGRRPMVATDLIDAVLEDANANALISAKIKVLRDEGKSQQQAVAMAINMQKEGRLRPGGVYVRAKK